MLISDKQYKIIINGDEVLAMKQALNVAKKQLIEDSEKATGQRLVNIMDSLFKIETIDIKLNNPFDY